MRWLDLWEMFGIRELCCSCCLPFVALQFSHYSSPGCCSQSCTISTLINISVCWQYNHLSRRLSIIGSISPLHTHKGCHGDLRPALWRLPWHQCLPVFCWHGDLSASSRMKQFKFVPVEHNAGCLPTPEMDHNDWHRKRGGCGWDWKWGEKGVGYGYDLPVENIIEVAMSAKQSNEDTSKEKSSIVLSYSCA